MLHFLNKMSKHVHISQLLNNKSDFKSHRVNSDVASSPFHARISATENARAFTRSRKEKFTHGFLDKCPKYARILREFRANFAGLSVDLNPFRAFPCITHEREPSNFRGDCTVYFIQYLN